MLLNLFIKKTPPPLHSKKDKKDWKKESQSAVKFNRILK
jgi:hypothetical protein